MVSLFSAIVLLGSVQGFILALAIIKLKDRDVLSSRFLSLFIFTVSLTLLGRFFYGDAQFTELKLKFLFFGDFIIFLYGPFLYLWISRILRFKQEFNKKELLHFIPALIFFLTVVPLYFSQGSDFWDTLRQFGTVYQVQELGAIIQNMSYIILSVLMVKRFEKASKDQSSIEPKTQFYTILFYCSLSLMAAWLVSFILIRFSAGYAYGDVGYQVIWILMSSTIFVLGYYTMSNSELFQPIRLIKEEEPNKKSIENLTNHVEKIEAVMTSEKVYLNPKLNLATLSEMVGIHTHLLSRIINEHYNRNFFDFINQYRVNEFITKINEENLTQFTILKLAYESGFNSKTTFNKSFKKNKGETPKEYISKVLVS